MLKFLLWGGGIFYGVQLLEVWLPFLAAILGRESVGRHPGESRDDYLPFFYILIPSRNAAESIPGLADCLRRQDYPADRFRWLLIADNCDDGSAEIARSLGVDVYERTDSLIKTKSDALNECLHQRLKSESFDALLILDVDARIAPDFLSRAAVHWRPSPLVLQGFHQGRNAAENPLTRIESAVAAMLRLRQRGRAVFGWPAYLIGSHGIVISRPALDRLEWSLCEGHHLTDDTELNLRCFLRGIPLRYATDLEVANELPSAARSIRTQRRRWAAGRLELCRPYLWPLMRRSLRGDVLAFQMMLDLLLSPPLSLLWAASGIAAVVLGIWSIQRPVWENTFVLIGGLFLAHSLYYGLALFSSRKEWRWRDGGMLMVYLGIRARSLAESVRLAFTKGDRWVPTPHGPDREKFL